MNDNYRAKVTIPGIPESIPHSALMDAFRSLGFNVNLVNSLEIRPDSVHVNLTAYTADGMTLTENGQRAEHHIVIPISGISTAA